jgi:dihydrolipoamide dehydrogenase
MRMDDIKNLELVVIGAGPGGYRAAFMAADLGIKVTLIDPKVNPGGVCLYHGCIPTKALLNLANVIKEADEAVEMGVKFNPPEIDVKRVVAWKNKVVKKLTAGLGQLVKSRKIKYIQGYARFLDAQTIEINRETGEKEKIKFNNAIIATGAKAVKLPGINYGNPAIMDAEKALQLDDIPENLLIVGGGYIGVELSIIFHVLGAKVSVAEMADNFLPDLDDDLVTEHRKSGRELYEDIFLGTAVESITEKEGKLEVTLKDKEQKKFTKIYDKVLVAIGEEPNTKDLGLENLSVEVDEHGFIKVNELQQTGERGIYAIGDVTGPPLLAHKASYEGRVAAEAVAGKKTANDARAIPAAIYTEPGIATCGLTEHEAKQKNISYKLVKFPWAASGRALTMNQSRGFTKLLIDPENERILGAGIVGKNAGDLIAELVVAIEMGATAEDIALSIHPHPTLSETIMEAAEIFYGHAAHRKS